MSDQATDPSGSDDPRIYFAAERTFLAWIRTGLGLMGVGFAVSRFGLFLREMREHYGNRWPRMRDGIERSGETVAKHGFTISAGEWQDDVAAAGVALKLNDGTGPYAFNCGAPAFRFTEVRLRSDIGPRLVAMVRNIEAALGGVAPQSKKEEHKKLKVGGKVARVVEGIR